MIFCDISLLSYRRGTLEMQGHHIIGLLAPNRFQLSKWSKLSNAQTHTLPQHSAAMSRDEPLTLTCVLLTRVTGLSFDGQVHMGVLLANVPTLLYCLFLGHFSPVVCDWDFQLLLGRDHARQLSIPFWMWSLKNERLLYVTGLCILYKRSSQTIWHSSKVIYQNANRSGSYSLK